MSHKGLFDFERVKWWAIWEFLFFTFGVPKIAFAEWERLELLMLLTTTVWGGFDPAGEGSFSIEPLRRDTRMRMVRAERGGLAIFSVLGLWREGGR